MKDENAWLAISTLTHSQVYMQASPVLPLQTALCTSVHSCWNKVWGLKLEYFGILNY